MLCAVLSIAGGRRALVGVVLVAPAAIGEWLNYWQPELLIYMLTRGAGLLFIGFVVVQLLRFIVYAPRGRFRGFVHGYAGYLLSGLAWALATRKSQTRKESGSRTHKQPAIARKNET